MRNDRRPVLDPSTSIIKIPLPLKFLEDYYRLKRGLGIFENLSIFIPGVIFWGWGFFSWDGISH